MKKFLSVLVACTMLFTCASAADSYGGGGGSTKPSPSVPEHSDNSAAEEFALSINGPSGTVCSVSGNVVTLRCSIRDIPKIEVPAGGKIIFDMGDNSLWAKETSNSFANSPLFFVPENADIEIINGSIDAADGGLDFSGGVAFENHGTLKITNTGVNGGFSQGDGKNGGVAIINYATLILDHSGASGGWATAEHGSADGGGGGGGGGVPSVPSIPNEGSNTLSILESAVSDAESLSGDGGTAIINNGTLTLKNSNLSGGYSESATGGTGIENNGTIEMIGENIIDGGYSRENSGGIGIINSDTFEAENTYIHGGSGYESGGTAIVNSGTLKLDNCNVTGGSSDVDAVGSGIENDSACYLKESRIESGFTIDGYANPGIINKGNIEIDNSVIFGGYSENDTFARGNGIDNFGTAIIWSGQVSGGSGHGIYNHANAELNIYDSDNPGTSVNGGSNNSTVWNAIYNEATLYIHGGEIWGSYSRTSDKNGSAAIYSTKQFTLNGGHIYGGPDSSAIIVEKEEISSDEFGFIFTGGEIESGYSDETDIPATSATFFKPYGYTTADRHDEFSSWVILRDASSTKKHLKCTKTLTLSQINSDVINGVQTSIVFIESSENISGKTIYVSTHDMYGKLVHFGKAQHITNYQHYVHLPYDSDGKVHTTKVFVWDTDENIDCESSAEIIKIR